MTEPSFFAAVESTLGPLTAARGLIGLVQGLAGSGLLAALREPVRWQEAAASAGMPERVATAVLEALVAGEVVTEEDGLAHLTAPWRALTAPTAYAPLDQVLAGDAVQARQLQAIAAGDTYWTMKSQDRIAYALSISPDPTSPARVAGFRASVEQHPVRALMSDGARVLELGCGVAGQLLTCLQAFPEMTAVGVELSDDLADVAEQRAAALGVGDRLRVVRGDAASFSDPEPFDVAHWSQFFFPSASRAGAVRAMLAALRPGGLAYLPLPWDFEEYAAHPTSGATRDYRLMRVLLSSWGVPEARYEDLVAELTAGGFVDVALIHPAADVPRVIARRP